MNPSLNDPPDRGPPDGKAPDGNAPDGNAPEDRARANHYAVLARLLMDAPDAALLRALADGGVEAEGTQPLPLAWRALAVAAARTEPAAARTEYDTAFVGVGKAPVTPYLSHYMVAVGHDKVLVQLRDALAALGLARDPRSVEPEDHVAALLEAMRHLCLQVAPDALARQRGFFTQYLQPGYREFCAAARGSSATDFYRPVADLLEAFLDTEQTAFEMI